MYKKITVIGAGPAGPYTAWKLAAQGFDIKVYEEHREIGRPVQCTGVVTQNLRELVELPKSCIKNTISSVRVVAKDREATFDFKKEEAILDRTALDNHLAMNAKKAGAKYFLRHRYEDGKIIDLKNGERNPPENGILIGADGPGSQVSRHVFKQANPYFVGAQVKAVEAARDPHQYTVYMGEDYGFFAWAVPEGKHCMRIGVMANRGANTMLDKLLEKNFPDAKILERQGGLIPKYQSGVKTQCGNTYLVGDAASQVKNSTGGGLVTGLSSAGCLADAIIKGQPYEASWQKKIGLHLWMHMKIQKAVMRLTEEDCSRLIRYAAQPRIKRIIEQSDRDHAFFDMMKIVLLEPRLIRFSSKAL